MIRYAPLALLFACGSYGFFGTSTQRGAERQAAGSWVPSEIGPRLDADPKAQKLTVRIWADEDFQRLTLDWQIRLHRQIERANQVLRAVLGVELDVVQVKTWPQQGRMLNLSSAIFNLAEHDPGADVDLVIGLISPLPVASAAIHELGRATPLGKHMVLRGTDDAEEMARFRRAFSHLSEEERTQLYSTRQRHKEELILLHELGHLFGALHVAVPTAIMQPTYDHRASGFAPVDVEIMKIALRERNQSEKKALVQYLSQSTFEGFVGSERVRMLALLTGDPRQLARATDVDVGEAQIDGEERAPAGSDPVRDAAELVKQGKDKEAWLLLKPMLAKTPDDPNVVNLSCGLAARRETSTTAESLCRRALELVPEDPAPALYLGFVLVEADRGGEDALAEAEKRLLALGERAPREGWGFLARLHQRALSVSAAERAAARAEGTEDAIAIPKWAKKIRSDFGIPEGVLTPEREGSYLRRRNQLNELTRQRRFKEAKKMASELAADFPDLPGPDSVLCFMLVSQRENAQALDHCKRAVQAEPESAQLRVLIGYAAFGARRPTIAIPHLERALAMEPARKDVWSLLAAAYRSAGKRDLLLDLRGRYVERFGEQLR